MRNFIFDVDRTLVDSYTIEQETLKEALKLVVGENFNQSIMNDLTILTTDDFFKKIGIFGDKEILEKVNKNWGLLLSKKKIKLFDGIREQLQLLKNNNCFLGICTSRNRSELEELEELMNIISVFDCVVTSDMVSNPKPDPESINYILSKFSLELDKTIYIGDSPSDYIAAREAKIKFGYACWENKNQPINDNFILNSPNKIISLCQK